VVNPRTRNLLEVNAAVLLWGGTALFAKLIPLPVPAIILGRSIMAVLALVVFMQLTGPRYRLNGGRDTAAVLLIGVLLGIHWLTYFQAIRVSTVAVGIIALHTYPILTILLEPLFFRERLHGVDLMCGLAVMAGIVILVPEFRLDSTVTQGVLLGVLSAVFFALRNILTRVYVRRYSSSTLMFYQVLVIAIMMVPYGIARPPTLDARSVGLLALLGALFTALPQTLFTSGHAHLKAKTVSIIATMLPVYGAITAFLLLGEVPSWRTVLGGVIVVGAVVVETLRSVSAPPVKDTIPSR
jgi:drug/metabolite transporter (DMT)-like permease